MKKRNGQKKEYLKYCNKNDKGSKVYFVVDLVDGQQNPGTWQLEL